jgi:hypothetical protein
LGKARRGVRQQHGHLAAQIHACEVIVLEFRRVHALADEHHRRLERALAGIEVYRGQEVLLEDEFRGATVAGDGQPGPVPQQRAAAQRHGLEESAVLTSWLEPMSRNQVAT